MQAAKLGVVTRRNLAQHCRARLPRAPRLLLWAMAEVAIIGSDIQGAWFGPCGAARSCCRRPRTAATSAADTQHPDPTSTPTPTPTPLPPEVIGSAIAVLLLTRGAVPLWGGILMSAAASFLLLLVERLGIRHLEALFAGLIATMVRVCVWVFVCVWGDGCLCVDVCVRAPPFEIAGRATNQRPPPRSAPLCTCMLPRACPPPRCCAASWCPACGGRTWGR